jgi:arginyl-tRNA synthetase
MERSLSFEGDTGPYIQYTYARSKSVLRKAEAEDPSTAPMSSTTAEERRLCVLLLRFPEIVQDAAQQKAPHVICTYLLDLCHAFNSYYAHEHIIGSENENDKLLLTAAIGNCIKQGLYLLGIETVESM